MRVSFDDWIGALHPPDSDLLLLTDALNDLTRLDSRHGQIVGLRFLEGRSEEDVATVLSLARATITGEWQPARAWICRRSPTGRSGGAS